MRDEFVYHQPTEDQLLYMDAVREAYSALVTALEEAAVPCRYRSLAMTALEESAMWANKAIVHGHSGNRSDHGVQRFPGPPPTSDTAIAAIANPLPAHLGEVRP